MVMGTGHSAISREDGKREEGRDKPLSKSSGKHMGHGSFGGKRKKIRDCKTGPNLFQVD